MIDPKMSALIAEYRAGGIGTREVQERLLEWRSRGAPRALSEGQKGLWILQKSYPQMTAYNIPLCFRVRNLNVPAFEEACRFVMRQHPVLDTTIRQEGGVPHAVADSSGEIAVHHEDLSASSADEVLSVLRGMNRRVFRAEGERLTRVDLLRVAGEETIVLIHVHHMIFDGGSASILMNDLFHAYGLLLEGKQPQSHGPRATFDDFVRLEQQRLREKGPSLLAYWKDKLRGPLPVLALPEARPRAEVTNPFLGQTYSRVVPQSVAEAIEAFSTKERVYGSSVLLAAFNVLLSQLSGQRDIIVGMPVNERGKAFAGVVGFMINMVPIRTTLSRASSSPDGFRDLVQRVQRDVVDGMLHSYPFSALVRELPVDKSSERAPVFQAVFVYQDVLRGLYEPGLPFEMVREMRQEGEYELSVEVVNHGDKLVLDWKYHPELFDEATIRSMAASYEALLELVKPAIAQPEEEPAGVHELFEAQVRRRPDATAVSYRGRSLSYRELHEKSSALAQHLRALGVGPNVLVALLVERSLDMLVGLLAVLQAGGAYIPLDPEYPEERLAYILTDSKPRILLTQSALEPRARALLLDRRDAKPALWVLDAPAAAECPPVQHVARATSSDLVYVIYTSGSTGNPKGVMLPHRALTNVLRSIAVEPGMKAQDSLLAVTTFSFDMAQLELLLPLVTGGHCHICDSATIRDVELLKQRIRDVKPTIMQATPALWRMLFLAGWQNGEGVTIFCGGEALSKSLQDAFASTGSEAWNLYGPTEAAIYATGGLVAAAGPITIGRPVANTHVHILDEHLREVAPGEAGELGLAGEGLALGYLNQQALTDEKFVEDPCRPGQKLYRTGDLARIRDDDTIEYLGRIDFQIKIRGFRIEPGEVEYHLNRHDAVRESVVVARGEDEGKQLVAYYVPERSSAEGEPGRTQALKTYLRAKVPPYMVPDFLVAVDAIPLTANGKVDRTALMRRDPRGPVDAPKRAAPRPRVEAEARIRAIWREVLKIHDVGVGDPFFEVGGNSLAAVVLAEKISQGLQVPFAARDLFKYPNIRSIAEYVQGAAEPQSPRPPSPEPVRAESDVDGVAVIGLSCHFPGAKDHHAFWDNLVQGKDASRTLTRDELRDAGVPQHVIDDRQHVAVQFGIDGKEYFDGEFFKLSPHHVALMDPQFRQLLMHAWKAVEDAGYDHRELPNTGVYVSSGNYNYGALGDDVAVPATVMEDPQQYLAWVMSQSGTIPAMISYQLGFVGPSLSVHSNCSSSLNALAVAFGAVQSGEIDCALVAAASAVWYERHGYVHQPGLNFSSDGRIKTFDAGADGMVGGEGVGAILIRRASEAIAKGDAIYAVLRGIASNSDGGASAGFYSPSIDGQVRVIRKVLERTGIHPETVGYVEAHGTGTKLGDPVELGALTEAYRAFTANAGYCGVGSLKPNIGHLDTAAGLAGCIKVVLSLHHRAIPPSIHCTEPNPEIGIATSPFYIAREFRAWETSAGPRRAALNAIGLGGTNTHAIFEEYAPRRDARASTVSGPSIVPLSAREQVVLVEAARALLAHVRDRRGAEGLRLEDIAHTLQVGRVPMPWRVAFVVDDLDELLEQLALFCEGKASKRYVTGRAGADAADAERIARWVEAGKAKKLAKAWVSGADLDWRRVSGAAGGQRSHLPTYPFRRVAHPWAERTRRLPAQAHETVARVGEARSRSRFDGNEYFIRDHVVAGKRLLPAVAGLEMVRAATRPARAESQREVFALEGIHWLSPVVVDGAGCELDVVVAADGPAVHFEIRGGHGPGRDVVHVQGRVRAAAGRSGPSPRVDLASLRARLGAKTVAGAVCYAFIARAGVDYGPGFRALDKVHCGPREALAELRLPDALLGSFGEYVLHPTLMDAAIQAAVGLEPRLDDVGHAVATQVPFGLDELEVFGAFEPTMFAWVRFSARHVEHGTGTGKILDIDLVNARGDVCAAFRGMAFRPMHDRTSTLKTLVPVWMPRASRPSPVDVEAVIFDGGQRHADAIRALYPRCDVVRLGEDDSLDAVREKLADRTLSHIVWMAPAPGPDVVADQERGVIQLFRIIKAVLALGYGTKNLTWTVLTFGTQRVRSGEAIEPTHAGVHGLMGSLAKEYTTWDIRLLDLALDEAVPWGEVFAATDLRGRGETAALRRGRWFSQYLLPTQHLPADAPPYREGGVYVVLGGAGGIGELWSRFMVEHHRASIVWIGRRPKAGEVEAKLSRLAELADGVGAAAPMYLCADACDGAALEAAHREIKVRHSRIDGVVHSAIVLLDKSLANMDESRFRASLASKVDTSVNLARTFGREPLDFLVFFSSLETFAREPGQANYAAGCTFADAFADSLGQSPSPGAAPRTVKIMNWGYWGIAGVVSDPFYQRRMAAHGIDSLEPDEGMRHLGSFLASDWDRVALVRTMHDRALGEMCIDDRLTFEPPERPSVVEATRSAFRPSPGDVEALLRFRPHPRFSELAHQLTFVILRDEGLLAAPARAGWRYERWLAESQQRLLPFAETASSLRAEALWQQWHAEKSQWYPTAALKAQVDLVESCLMGLRDVLSGARQATEILFPQSSVERVEGVYRGHPIVDYFNAQLSQVLGDALHQWRKGGARGIRILEVGAGTGATSAKVLEALAPFHDAIEEYRYTDLSKAFLFRAEEKLAPSHPFLRTQIFDVEQHPSEQGLPLGYFDIVVATNVLHATSDIARTLRHVKATMRKHGLLVMNELGENTMLAHVTFGLLDGWWVYEDAAWRIPGSPILEPRRWLELFEEEGFARTWQPDPSALRLGQQILVAESDGAIRRGRALPQVAVRAPVASVASVAPARESGSLAEKAAVYFKGLVAGALKLSPAEIAGERDLFEYGLDSILIVQVNNALGKIFDGLSSTLFFDFPTIDGLVAHFLQAHGEVLRKVLGHVEAGPVQEVPLVGAAPVPSVSVAAYRGDIAIVGLSGRYPKAENVEELWANLRQGVNCAAVYPADRWWCQPKAGETRWGGFLTDVGCFDAEFFGISDKEAAAMDPQERVFIETVYGAIQDAGRTPSTLCETRKVGVFVGVMNATYNGRAAYSSIANRTSHLFDFRGPSVALDTACSSSLTAIHLAVESLRSGDIDCAVAGGVNLILDLDHFELLSEFHLLSAGGECRPFSERADGFVASEGVGAVVLRPLEAAIEQGDSIYAVIKGTAINAGGRTSKYQIPNVQAQKEVIERALAKSNVDPSSVSYVEAHGTATSLGDSIEVSALTRAFASEAVRARPYCALGSVKSNIGHCESASGVASLSKVVMQMKYGEIAPSIHARDLNSGIVFQGSPFAVQQTLRSWEPVDAQGRPAPKRAGISCFGAGGSNAHVVVEEYVPPFAQSEPEGASRCLVPLSARTRERLAIVARQLRDELGRAPGERSLRDIAYTLQVGREAMRVRFACVVASVSELMAALEAFLAGSADPQAVREVAATSKVPSKAVESAVADGRLEALRDLWLEGAAVSWQALYPSARPKRVRLPTYPFERKEHWETKAIVERAEPEAPDLSLRLTQLVARQLNVAPREVRPDVTYLDLGLSSQGLVQLAREIKRDMDATFEAASLFEHDTVERLAAHLSGASVTASTAVTPAVPQKRYPLSEGQQGLWMLQKTSPQTSGYNVPLCFRVRGLDAGAFVRAFAWACRQHAVLDSVIEDEAGHLVHAPRPDGAPAVATHDASTLDEAAVLARLRDDAKQPFDLKKGPLCRASIYRVANDEAILLLNAHHIVFDGTSAAVFLETLEDAYTQFLSGTAPAAVPGATHEELVHEERAMLQGDEGNSRLAYWRTHLAAPVSAPGLRTDRPRSEAARSIAGDTVSQRLSGQLGDEIQRFAARHELYPSSVFLALLNVLLHRYTAQDDILVGMPINARQGARFARTVGYGIHMLPVRNRIAPGASVLQLCREVQKNLINGMAHAYPLSALVRELRSFDPAFDVAFMYQDWHTERPASSVFRYVEGIHQEGEYPLVLEVTPPRGGTGFSIHWKFDPALFDRATIETLDRHYRHLLETALRAPHGRIEGCTLVSAEERTTLLATWNDTRADYPEDKCLHELFAARAAVSGSARALTFGRESMTYAQLDAKSTLLASYLQRTGVGANRLVAVYMERCLDLVVALLAVSKAGGAYIPLDPMYPKDRLSHILEDSRAEVVLTLASLEKDVERLCAPHAKRAVLAIDARWAQIESAAGTPLEKRATSADLAYVIYTSGSTGRPKGVMIPHRALTNFLHAMAKRPGLRAGDRMLAVTTHSFDIAGLELWLPLVQGAECHICDSGTAKDGARLQRLIETVRPTVMQATPSTWSMLFHAGWRNHGALKVLCGGEALPESLKQRFVETSPDAWNLFGPTETTIWSTIEKLERDEPIRIGRPIDNTRVYIVDAHGELAPQGLPGELCIAGDGLAKGYWNQPDLTAEKFQDDPFVPGGKMYKTGDLARWSNDGRLEYLGRMDTQVKIRGFRVELGEIETTLSRHSAVRACVVVARAQSDSKQLIAYYTSNGGTGPDELKRHLADKLPEYMIPAFFVALAEIPRTPNGKADRKALAERDIALAPAKAANGATDMAALWREVLGVANLRAGTGFFDAGGNSVTAAILADKISERYGIPFAATEVFKYPKLADLDAYVLRCAPENAQPAAALEPSRTYPDYVDGSVAIIGISCRFPGAADHREFWQNLLDGREGIRFHSADDLRRKGVDEGLIQDPRFVPVDASLEGKGLFDADFFHVSARDAELTDPQARLLLQHAWKAVEDAAYVPDDIPDTAVYVSTCHAHYQAPLHSGTARRDSEALVNFLVSQPGMAPTTISHKLGLKGPSLFVHSNCSSSLAAVALAVQTIQSKQSRYALVGAATVYSENEIGYVHEEGLNLSADGHCKAFDAGATGMIGGEGVAVVLLKDARLALEDGDHVYALLRGVAMNNDGGDKAGFYAPSVGGQAGVIGAALARTGIDPETIRYVEAHGTGTRLGDPIEVMALSDAYRRYTNKVRYCGIGSVKTNIGHLDTAAGLAGLIKTALILHEGLVPPTVHYRTPNPNIDFEASPFYVVDALTKLERGPEPHRAAVSSFGIGGTNVHAILEAAPEFRPTETDAAGPWLVPLSAKGEESLRRYAFELAAEVERLDRAGAANLADIAFTLQVGRTAMPVRVAFVVPSVRDLVEALRAFAGGAERPTASGSALEKEAASWMAGAPVDWRRAHGTARAARRVSLPTYPFREEYHWLPRGTRAPATELVTANRVTPLLFEERWVPAPLPSNGVAHAAPSRIVCLLSGRDARRELTAAIRAVHPHVDVVFVGRDDDASVEQTLTGLARSQRRVDALYDLWPVEDAACRRDVAQPARIARALRDAGLSVPEVLLAGSFENAIEQASLDAMVAYERSIGHVLPGTAMRIVMHAGAASMREWASILELERRARVSALYRDGVRHACRVEPLDPVTRDARPVLRPRGTYLVTGGVRGLGRHVAEHLARSYAANLLLLGRSPLGGEDAAWLHGLERHGGKVVHWQVDVSDARALEQGWAALPEVVRAVDGVIHAAGVAEDASFLERDAASFEAVLAPKIRGTLSLERLLSSRKLDFVGYFSSTAAVLGDFGSCDYAVANRFLAAYARAKRDAGISSPATVAICWPLWDEGSMGASARRRRDPGTVEAYLARSGQKPLDTASGLRLFEQLLAADSPSPLVMLADETHARAMLRVGEDAARGNVQARLTDELLRITQAALKMPLSKSDMQKDFAALGLDSIRLTQLAGRLSEHFGVKVLPSVFFDYSSLARLVEYFTTNHPEAQTEVRPEVPAENRAADEPIAIIGVSGIFPGARSVSEFWDVLVEGKHAVREIPASRFRTAEAPWMGSIDGVDEFDPLFFEISPREAKTIDPRQRHLLQQAWNALEDAALGPVHLEGRRVGVFVGVEQGDYPLLVGEQGNLTSNHDGILAARLSYFLDLKGPVLAINTSCSSGLVAVHQACMSLRAGESEVAIAAAANLLLTPQSIAAMSAAGMLSSDGRCRTFDREASGMVPGEAVAAVILKPLHRAEADGDPIYSLIVASGINYDGKTNGITAPAGDAQRGLLESIYRARGIHPEDIGYIVTHGTGTKLGDPVEVNALDAVFKGRTNARGFCALTSTKTNFGHTFAASGLLGLMCLSESIRHGIIPASLHCEHENEFIEWSQSPFYVNKQTARWNAPPGKIRMGGVSAFGMSGTNAHVVVKEYVRPHTDAPAPRPYYVLPLAAKTELALEQRIDAMIEHIERAGLGDADLPQLSDTLAWGRHHFRHRCAVVVTSMNEAVAQWRAIRAGSPESGSFVGVVPREFEARPEEEARMAQALAGDRADLRETQLELAESYIRGYGIPSRGSAGSGAVRLRLPTYPFARNRYWVDAEVPAPSDAPHVEKPNGIVLSPLPVSKRPPVSKQRVTETHDVLEDLKSAAPIGMPGMVATLNRTGVMVEHLIPYSQEFAEYAGRCDGEVLDLGCAYGVATIAALERGARVVALDMERKHLDILQQRVNDGARSRLTVTQGTLPGVDFEDGRFAAIHASRVLHFLSPEGVRTSLRKMHRWLKPGGKIFLSSDSPYFGYWAAKSSDYEQRKRGGDAWPGFITNVLAHFDAKDVAGGPNQINALDPDVFRRECAAAGFTVDQAGFFGGVGLDRGAQGAPREGMEHAGVIATKGHVDRDRREVRTTDGNIIHYDVEGRGRTALVFIHGLGCDAAFWKPQVEHFQDRYTVITLDLAGHGRSSRNRQRWSIEAFAGDVVAVIERVAPANVILVGHSLGGPIMLEAAKRLDARVRCLIGVDALHNLEPKPMSNEKIDRYLGAYFEHPIKAEEMVHDKTRSDVMGIIERSREATGAHIVSAAMREMLVHLQSMDKDFAAPLTLVNSESWMPTNLAAARKYGVQVELVKDAGHFIMLENPEALNRSIEKTIDRLGSSVSKDWAVTCQAR